MLKEVPSKFKMKFSDAPIPNTTSVYEHVRSFYATDSTLRQGQITNKTTHKLHLYKTTVLHKLYTTGCKARGILYTSK
jgi:stage III sporulation protein SpoIIIAA